MDTKDIGAYILYSDGRVFKKSNSKFMYGSTNNQGYINISINGLIKKFHRLIAEAFVPNPHGKLEVNHINGIKSDNRAENLEWATHSENILHAFKIGLNTPNYGSKNGWSKLKEHEVIDIKKQLLEPNVNMSAIGRQYKVSVQNIWRIREGIVWSHLII